MKSKGISEISYWFVSHADEDHINGLYELMEAGYKIDNLEVSQSAAKCDEKTAEITELARKLNINIIKYLGEINNCWQKNTNNDKM